VIYLGVYLDGIQNVAEKADIRIDLVRQSLVDMIAKEEDHARED